MALSERAGAWIDRTLGIVAPRAALKRQRARLAFDLFARHFEAAAHGRRTSGWRRASTDVNAAAQGAFGPLRNVARDLIRNNPLAAAALDVIADHAVGWGIVPVPELTGRSRDAVQTLWQAWAGTPACDADGRQDFYGLQKQIVRTMAESGEVLVRRRVRLASDGFPIPLQLQVLEPDYLDDTKTMLTATGRIIQGVEFNPIGQRIAYWLYPEHPGATLAGATGGIAAFGASQRIPATEILHVFKPTRPGQVRGTSWFAPILLRLKDFDEFEDATLMKQKIAACLAVIVTDLDGTAPALGETSTTDPTSDTLEPGMILNRTAGGAVTVVQPPTVREFADYAKSVLHSVASGLGLTYEDLIGDYENLPYSAARLSRLRHQPRVDDWRWRLLIPQFCDPAWRWAMQAAAIVGQVDGVPPVRWTAPPMPMLEPDKEGLAYQRNVRSGLMSLSEALRELGYEPDAVFAEMAADNAALDRLGLVLDSDPRKTTQQGNLQAAAATPPPAAPGAMPMAAALAGSNGHGEAR